MGQDVFGGLWLAFIGRFLLNGARASYMEWSRFAPAASPD